MTIMTTKMAVMPFPIRSSDLKTSGFIIHLLYSNPGTRPIITPPAITLISPQITSGAIVPHDTSSIVFIAEDSIGSVSGVTIKLDGTAIAADRIIQSPAGRYTYSFIGGFYIITQVKGI